jgi:hypothetical protein
LHIIVYIFLFRKEIEMIKNTIDGILADYNKIAISSLIVKAIVATLLFIAFQGQTSSFYATMRWIVFPLLLILVLLDNKRGKNWVTFGWVSLAVFFNPLIPIYFNDYDKWRAIDSLGIIFIIASAWIYDIVGYNSESEIAQHINRRALKIPLFTIDRLLETSSNYYDLSMTENRNNKKRNLYLKISEKLLGILIGYLGMNAELYIRRGIVTSRLYHFSVAKLNFDTAHEIDKNYIIPSETEVHNLTFTNFKEFLYVSD